MPSALVTASPACSSGSPKLVRPGRDLPEDPLDAALAEQRRDWMTGRRTPAAERLRRDPALASDPGLAAELVYHEYTLRQELGEAPDWGEYLRQFPQHAAVLRLLRQADQVVERALAPAAPASLPDQLGDYELLGQVGRGGMGVVYKARQKSLDRVVALKLMQTAETPGEEERKRFDREARAVARLCHPNIVQIHNVGEADGQPFLALEFVGGGSLANRLDGTPLPARRAATLIGVLARAMDHAHANGVIHRDLKPSNVLLAGAPQEWVPKVTDFGLARRLDADTTGTGAALGTPSYMAPEQAEPGGATTDPRTDVYGLGAILYELLTGRPPFRAESALQTLRQVLQIEPARPRLLNPAVPRDLETVCLKCLEKEPHRRYPSAAALADDLERWLRGEPVKARRTGPLGRARRWCRRKPLPAALAAALALALLVGFAAVLYQWQQAVEARREAEASDAQAQHLLGELLPSSPGAPQHMRYTQRLPSIDALRKAEAHFDGLLRKRPQDTSVRVALTNVRGALGNLYLLRGRMAEMEQSFQAARDLWEARARQDPRNQNNRDWLATACYWQFAAAAFQTDFGREYRLLLRAAGLWQELAEERPGDVPVLQKVADCRWRLLVLRVGEPGWEESLPLLEEERAKLARLVGEGPAGTALRKRLALACLVLGQYHLGMLRQREALACWRQAYEHYRELARERPDDPLVKLNLAICCSRLAGGQPAGPHYTEAVSLLGPAADRLAALARQHPEGDGLRYALLEAHCLLAVCHWKAGRAAQGERAFRDQVRPLAEQLCHRAAAGNQGFSVLHVLLRAAGSLGEVKHPAALAVAREAAALAERSANAPSRDLEFCEHLAGESLVIATMLRHLRQPAEALPLAEQGRRLFSGLRRAVPALPRYGEGLNLAWEQIAKARWDLGRGDEALAAFRESAAAQRRVVEQAPSVRLYRVRLSRCYDRLAHWSGLRGDRAGAAAALLEREKVWPGDAKGLLEVSSDFGKLAEAVGKDPEKLSPQERAERDRYLAESERVRKAAEAARGSERPPVTPAAP
jgi:hypothetical protein